MADERLKILLVVFAATALFSVTAAGIFLSGESISGIESRIARYEKSIGEMEAALKDKESLESRKTMLLERIEARTERMYAGGETDMYAFGMLVRKTLSGYGLKVASYRPAESDSGNLLEFSCSASAAAFMNFLKGISVQDRKWIVHSLELKSDDGGMLNIIMRIGYEENSADPR